MGTKSREVIYGSSIRASAERAREARKEADRLAVKAWNDRMLGYQGPAQPSPTIGDALNAGHGYLEVRCLGCDTHQTVAVDIVRRPKATPIHELERYMRCKECSTLRGYPYKRSHLVAALHQDIGKRPAIKVVAGGAMMPIGGIIRTNKSRWIVSLVGLALTALPVFASEITGIPRIVDSDTVEIGQTKIRLSGIDAPETDQICLDAKREKWACGIAARDELVKHSNGQAWECTTTGTDQYGRSLANCFIEGEDVSAWMVRSGWALSFVRYSHAYDADETAARDAGAGLWSGSFIAPWDWRHRNKTTIILGGASVPVNAQIILLGAVSASEAPSPECVIKGNVNRKGERIYHLPGQLNYAQINMTKGLGERWFCSEADADAAGWRRAMR